MQRNGSGRWVAVSDDEEADEREPDAAPAPAVERVRSPAALVSIGGAAAAVAVVSTLFLWPAPRTTNSAISRPAPLVPAVTAPAEPTAELTPTADAHDHATGRGRRRRGPGGPSCPRSSETTPAPSVSTEPTAPTATASASEPPASESTTPTTDDDDQARGRLSSARRTRPGADGISADTREGPVPDSGTGPSRSSPDGIRTRATALRGRRPRPLDDGAAAIHMYRETLAFSECGVSAGVPGLEPRLTEPESVVLPITPYPKRSQPVPAACPVSPL